MSLSAPMNSMNCEAEAAQPKEDKYAPNAENPTLECWWRVMNCSGRSNAPAKSKNVGSPPQVREKPAAEISLQLPLKGNAKEC